MRRLIASALILFCCAAYGQQVVNTGKHRYAPPATGCTAPTLTSLWLPSNSAGSSGHPGVNDPVGSNPGTASSGYPAYSATGGGTSGTTSQLTFTSASSQTLGLATPIPVNWTTYSGFAVFKGTTFAGSYVLGASSSSSGFDWYIDGTPNVIISMNQGSTGIFDSTSHSTGTWYTEAWQWNTSTGAYGFWRCSGGTCSSLKSGTATASPGSNGFAWIGSYGDFADYFNGSIAAMGIYNGAINTTTLGTYTHCEGWN